MFQCLLTILLKCNFGVFTMPGYEKNDDYTPAQDLALCKLRDEWLAENGFPDKINWREIKRRARRAVSV